MNSFSACFFALGEHPLQRSHSSFRMIYAMSISVVPFDNQTLYCVHVVLGRIAMNNLQSSYNGGGFVEVFRAYSFGCTVF